jgi:hypothetical protein
MTSRKATAKTRQWLRCFLGREADFSAARLTMGPWAAPVEQQQQQTGATATRTKAVPFGDDNKKGDGKGKRQRQLSLP